MFILGLFNLNKNETPFILAKEIDLSDDFSVGTSTNQVITSPPSPFLRTNKFKDNKPTTIQSASIKTAKNNNEESQDVNIKREDEPTATSGTSTSDISNQQISENKKGEAKENTNRPNN